MWYLAGTPDPNSQLVEFRDFTVLIESSVTEARALANIAEAKRVVPNKPLRYHVNSHHHGDHAAGLRAFIAEGATIVTHEMNKRFYEQIVLKAPRTLAPDTLSKNPRAATFMYVRDKQVITDGDRTLEVYTVANGHAANLLMAYLPQGEGAAHHGHLQRLRRAASQRSATRDREPVLRGAGRPDQAVEARRRTDRSIARQGPGAAPPC